MLKMRLQRVGRRNHPTYRVVVVDSRQGPKSGKYVDLLGSYDPHRDHVQVDGDRAKEWIQKGVQASPTVHNILVGQKIIDGKKVNVLPKKSPIVSESEEAEVAEAPQEETTEASEETAPEAETPATEEAPAEEVKEETPEEVKEEEAKEEETPEEAPEEEKKEG